MSELVLESATREYAEARSTPSPIHGLAPVEAPAVDERRPNVAAAVGDVESRAMRPQVVAGVVPMVPHAETARAATEFESVRSRLFGIAYQMLGRAADAEDVVQDAWIRWQGVDRARVRDRVAFLATITTRLALNAATSARVRREVSFGVGLPEPAYAAADPAAEAERGEELGHAVHILVERLPPVERAVYVLREAFGYSFRDISDVLGLREANARQLARRARMHLAEQRHSPVDPAERDGLLDAFLDAARGGDIARLTREVVTEARPLRQGAADPADAAPRSGRPTGVITIDTWLAQQ